jgi:predicted nucleic-acid-binding Zn-ribbon protein
MAISTCPKCSNHSFEVQEFTPTRSNYKFLFVQCSSCGVVIGVMDY